MPPLPAIDDAAITRAAPSDVPIATGTHPGQRADGRKPQSLPPPGEMTQHAEEDLRAATLRAARRADTRKKHSTANKPITARQKMRAVRATIGSERDNRDEKREIRMPSKSARGRVLGLTKLLEMQSKSAGWGVS